MAGKSEEELLKKMVAALTANKMRAINTLYRLKFSNVGGSTDKTKFAVKLLKTLPA